MKYMTCIILLGLAIVSKGQTKTPYGEGDTIRRLSFYKRHDSIALIGSRSYDRYVQDYFDKNFHPVFDTVALFGMSWTKFRIGENGDVTDIQSDPTTPPVLQAFIATMLQQTKGQWNMHQPKSTYIQGATIVLPIQYTMEYRKHVTTVLPPQISVQELNTFLNNAEQQRIFFLPVVEFFNITYY